MMFTFKDFLFRVLFPTCVVVSDKFSLTMKTSDIFSLQFKIREHQQSILHLKALDEH